MTTNVSCLFFVLTSTLILGHSPFNVIQLLWINLIMDVLAAIAFSTENPHPTQIRKERIKEGQKVITQLMMRNILSQVLYQVIVMIILLYAAPAAGGHKYNLFKDPMKNDDGSPSNRILHQTFMFQCFVMMNLFNMVNCRVLGSMPARSVPIEESSLNEVAHTGTDGREFNIFVRIHHNWWFLIILFAELNIQYIMVGYNVFAPLFTTTPITFSMHLTAVLLGLGSWAIAALTKLTPAKLVYAMPVFGED